MRNHLEICKCIRAFANLGEVMLEVSDVLIDDAATTVLHTFFAKRLRQAALESERYNKWFHRREIGRALNALGLMLNEKALADWVNHYPGLHSGIRQAPKKVAAVMAGNIPLVGFHDLLCVVISGNVFFGKPSSQDAILPAAVAEILTALEPCLKGQIVLTEEVPKHADGVIATGSDNTARYFEHRFSGRPHIIRKNRNSTALVSGNETQKQLELLGKDVFYYYGKGCRSVSHVLLPRNFDPQRLANAWQPFHYILQNQKYKNNIDFQKAVYSVDEVCFVDLKSCLLSESEKIASPISVLHYSRYGDISEAEAFIRQASPLLQCAITDTDIQPGNVPVVHFGMSQYPRLESYADGIDTMKFLINLR